MFWSLLLDRHFLYIYWYGHSIHYLPARSKSELWEWQTYEFPLPGWLPLPVKHQSVEVVVVGHCCHVPVCRSPHRPSWTPHHSLWGPYCDHLSLLTLPAESPHSLHRERKNMAWETVIKALNNFRKFWKNLSNHIINRGPTSFRLSKTIFNIASLMLLISEIYTILRNVITNPSGKILGISLRSFKHL